MNKILISFLLLFAICDVYADVIINTDDNAINPVNINCGVSNSCGSIDIDIIKQMPGDKYIISNSDITMNNFSQWQDWDADVELNGIINLYVDNFDNVKNDTLVKYAKGNDTAIVEIIDTHNLYKTRLYNNGNDVYMNIVRETNYEKIFKDARGKYLENIRKNTPNDKMLMAMDAAGNMSEINSIMNSSYRFNPIILMNPVKTINRARLINMDMNFGAGILGEYLTSDKIKDIDTQIKIGYKYQDLYFGFGVNIDKFSFDDKAFNVFNGVAYGADFEIRQYINNLWFGGIGGVRQIIFKSDDIYSNGNVIASPKGISEYARINIGYDYTKLNDFILSPFVGLIFQNLDVVDMSDTNINLIFGAKAKYDFTIDGIKYEYGFSLGSDENACWNIGGEIGFISISDAVGATIKINAFKDDFNDINYQATINANLQF